MSSATQTSVTALPSSTGTDGRTAIVGQLAGVWGVLIVEASSSGLRVVSQASGKETSADDRIASAILTNKAKRVLTVVVTQQSTARTLALPADAAVDSASVNLFGEAHAPAGAPAHRVGAGILRSSGAAPVLLVTSWVEESIAVVGQSPAASAVAGLVPAWLAKVGSAKVIERCTTPAAGIAALLAIGASDAIAYSDGDCIIAAAKGEKGASLRAVVEDDDDREAWTGAVQRVLAGLVAHVGGDASRSRSIQSSGKSNATNLEEGVLNKWLSGAPKDSIWRIELLPLLGAALLLVPRAAGETLGACAMLSRREPVPEVPAVVKVGAWAGRKRVWPVLVGAAALLLAAGPIGLTRARANIAKTKAAELDKAREKTKDLELKAAVYEQLDTTRWPLSKMLADVSAAAPVGVSVKSLRMTVGQPLSVQGEAKDNAQVNQFQEALANTGQYKSIKQNRVSNKPSGEGVEFDLAAEAVNLHAPVAAKEDFVATPLAVRLYGEGAINTSMPVGAVKQVKRSSASRTSTTSGNSGAGAAGDKPAETTRRPTEAPSTEPPVALTDEDIGKLTSGEAMKGWTTRRTYLQRNAGIDAGLKARLEEEIKKLQEQQKKANASTAEKKEGGS